MSKRPTRLGQLSQILSAMVRVIVSGSSDLTSEPAAPAAQMGRIMPLCEEFSDLFIYSKKKFIGRLRTVAFTDLRDPGTWPEFSRAKKRELLLRRTSVMPSMAVEALARISGMDPNSKLRSLHNAFPYYLHQQRAAIEIGSDVEFVGMCWYSTADLDAQWHALRNELFKIRAELAAKKSGV